MDTLETKAFVEDSLKKLKESIKRQINYTKEIADDRIALKAVLADQKEGVELDSDSGYVTYNEWVEQLNKEIKTGVTSLDRIEREKAQIIAYEFYLENIDKAEPAE
ncbi:hypothetical protein [Fusobacterium sp. MFO224]|uniref:hypothetical protein n=1 Tax=Fusobacterium sp. MFO224 TaxID=3378070 RepID=UPI003854F3DD